MYRIKREFIDSKFLKHYRQDQYNASTVENIRKLTGESYEGLYAKYRELLKYEENLISDPIVLDLTRDDVTTCTTYNLESVKKRTNSFVKVDIMRDIRRFIAQRYILSTFIFPSATSGTININKNHLLDDIFPTLEYDKLLFIPSRSSSVGYDDAFEGTNEERDAIKQQKKLRQGLANILHSKTPYCLNRGFSLSYNVPYVPINDQIAIASEYTEAQVKAWLKIIAKKKINMTFLGLGGMNLNVIENLSQLCSYFSIKNLFEKILIIEPEDLEYHNLIRFNTAQYLRDEQSSLSLDTYLTSALTALTNAEFEVKKLTKLNKLVLLDRSSLGQISQKAIVLSSSYIKDRAGFEKLIHSSFVDKFEGVLNDKPLCIFGSPEVATRNIFSSFCKSRKNVSFLCATHQNETVELKANPVPEDSSLIVETYGSIRLTPFLVNIMRVTLETIKYLAENDLTPDTKQIYHHTFEGINGSKYTYNSSTFETRQGVML